MTLKDQYFRFDFKGNEKSRDNSYLTIRHEVPKEGNVTVGISDYEDSIQRKKALEGLSQLSESIGKKSKLYRWNYHDSIMVETQGFDVGLGVLMSSNLEKSGVVPNGSTRKLRKKLKDNGHELQDDNISLLKRFGYDEEVEQQRAESVPDKEKRRERWWRIFRFRKKGRER